MTSEQLPAAGEANRILIVDDDAELLRGLRLSLSSEGYQVDVLARSEDAVAAIRRLRPDVVVLDVMMPEVDGWQILAALRNQPGTADLPVIMLTAKDSLQAKVAGFTLGADDYVAKPFAVQELRCRISAVLRRTRKTTGVGGTEPTFTAVCGTTGQLLVPASDVYYIDGVRNYTYLHSYDDKHLCRMTLREVQDTAPDGFMRVHRSYILNASHVRGGRWTSSTTYCLVLSDKTSTEIPLSRKRITSIQRELGLR